MGYTGQVARKIIDASRQSYEHSERRQRSSLLVAPRCLLVLQTPVMLSPLRSLVSAWRILSPLAKATIGKRSGHVDRCSSQKRIGIILANSWDSKDLLLTNRGPKAKAPPLRPAREGTGQRDRGSRSNLRPLKPRSAIPVLPEPKCQDRHCRSVLRPFM